MEDVAHDVKKMISPVSRFDKVEVTVGNSTQKKHAASYCLKKKTLKSAAW